MLRLISETEVMKRLLVIPLVLLILRRVDSQNNVTGTDRPCGQDNVSCADPGDPNNPDNCLLLSQLCDGIDDDCASGADEGIQFASLDCTGMFGPARMFRCTDGEVVDLDRLCDGVNNCTSGEDERSIICANKCLLPYYGGCDFTRECVSTELGQNCGDCLTGFTDDPNDLSGIGTCIPIPDPCDSDPCDINANCLQIGVTSEFMCRCRPGFTGDGFMCTRIMIGDDPHFSIVLLNDKILCYTVQGEHGFAFNLISNTKLHMNAMFVPDSRRSEVTWIGSLGIIVQNSFYQGSNVTKIKLDAKNNQIHIGNKVLLSAKNVDALTFLNGKLTISEAPPKTGFRYPSVRINLEDVGLYFTIKFIGEHLDMFWHSVGEQDGESHGLIGQFFRKEVEIDEVRKLLVLPGKEPVPVMRRPVWSFMEREMKDDQLCWTAMNPGYQGEGLIDGTYFDYLVNDVLSTDFVYMPKGHKV